jgi:hypothetical protein
MKLSWKMEDLKAVVSTDYAAHEKAVLDISRILMGRSPAEQGAILAQLTAIYFCGFKPEARARHLEKWLKLVHEMSPLIEGLLNIEEPE